MEKKYVGKKLILLLCLFFIFFFCANADNSILNDTTKHKQNIDYIDPTIGNVAQLLEPTRPTSYLPNQIIRVHPIRKDYLDDQISGFPLTVVSHRLGTVFCIRPSTYPVSADSWDRKMPYDQDLEITR